MSNLKTYFLTIVFLFMSFVFVIPNLSTDASNFESETKVLAATRIRERIRRRSNSNELVLRMTDSSLYYLSEQYSDYWSVFQDPSSKGKTLKIYHGNNTSYGHNPVQIEIDGKVIYTPAKTNIYKYIILVITFGFTVWSLVLLRKQMKKV